MYKRNSSQPISFLATSLLYCSEYNSFFSNALISPTSQPPYDSNLKSNVQNQLFHAGIYPNHKSIFSQTTSKQKISSTSICSAINDFSQFERIFAISDLHTDNVDNRSWLRNRCSNNDTLNEQKLNTPGPNDVLVIAGDISHDLDVLKETLLIITENLQCTIFFVPGNHEAWIGGEQMRSRGITDSLQKLELVKNLCSEMDLVEFEGQLIGKDQKSPAWLVPIQGWYDGSLSLPNCQDLCSDFNKFPWVDFRRCAWPQPQFPPHGKDHPNGEIPRGLVEYFLEQNELVLDKVRPSFDSSIKSIAKMSSKADSISFVDSCTLAQPKGLITFSHFLSTEKVLPDWKNVQSNVFLKDEWLDHGAGGISAKFAKVAGSSLLDVQIRSILPKMETNRNESSNGKPCTHHPQYRHLHVFGHSHRPKDVSISQVRYIHNPLGKPSERDLRMVSPDVDFQLIWDCTSDQGEVSPKENIVRYWEEKGGGKAALRKNMERRDRERKARIKAIMDKPSK